MTDKELHEKRREVPLDDRFEWRRFHALWGWAFCLFAAVCLVIAAVVHAHHIALVKDLLTAAGALLLALYAFRKRDVL